MPAEPISPEHGANPRSCGPLPARAALIGAVGLSGFAFAAIPYGRDLILTVLVIAGLVGAGWKCEALAHAGGTNFVVRAVSTLSRIGRVFVAFWTLALLVFGAVGAGAIQILLIPCLFAVVIYGFAGHLSWPVAATAQRHANWGPVVRPHFLALVGALIVIGLGIAWQNNQVYRLDLDGLSRKLMALRIVVDEFARERGRPPGVGDSAQLMNRESLEGIRVVANGVFEIPVDLGGGRFSALYVVAEVPTSNFPGLLFSCVHADPELAPTDRLPGSLKCLWMPGLQVNALATARVDPTSTTPTMSIYFPLGRSGRRHVHVEPVMAISPSPQTSDDTATVREQLSQTLARRTPVAVEIVAFADPTGNPSINLKLSEDRAASVRELLKQMGVPGPTISIRGGGTMRARPECSERKPVECLSRVRRADVYFRYR